MEAIIMGLAVAFNLMVIKYKIEHKRFSDGIMDLSMLILIGIFFSSSTEALMIGTMASAFISIFLYFNPPKFQFPIGSQNVIKEQFDDVMQKENINMFAKKSKHFFTQKKTRKIKGW